MRGLAGGVAEASRWGRHFPKHRRFGTYCEFVNAVTSPFKRTSESLGETPYFHSQACPRTASTNPTTSCSKRPSRPQKTPVPFLKTISRPNSPLPLTGNHFHSNPPPSLTPNSPVPKATCSFTSGSRKAMRSSTCSLSIKAPRIHAWRCACFPTSCASGSVSRKTTRLQRSCQPSFPWFLPKADARGKLRQIWRISSTCPLRSRTSCVRGSPR